MNRQKKSRFFTLIEVAAAVAILGISLAALLQLLISSRLRTGKAMEEWQNAHKLMQGAEYLMLQNEETSSVPETFFPYASYRIDAERDDAENLPEELNNQTGQIPLKCLTVSLVRESDGKTLDQLKIDYFSYDSADEGL